METEPKRKPGRPPKDEADLERAHIDVRLSDQMRRHIRVEAAKRDLSMGQWLKEAAMEKVAYRWGKEVGQADDKHSDWLYERAQERWQTASPEILDVLGSTTDLAVARNAFVEGYCSAVPTIPSVKVPTKPLHRP